MNQSIMKNLNNKTGNYISPFFWQHGEDEGKLREYMKVIHDCSIGAVCVESRPHPDFCGEKWWQDMDIILEEARKYDMKIWILDDSHFPTGYANGALENAPEELCRQGICYTSKVISGKDKEVSMSIVPFLKKKNDSISLMDMGGRNGKRQFSADILLSVTAISMCDDTLIDLTNHVQDNILTWRVPKGKWKIAFCKLSRNCGAHRNYINMMKPESCRILIDEVYEKHYEHYGEEFGKHIAGFFSDEPELGNGALYSNQTLGTKQDLPWSDTLIPHLEKKLGENWKNELGFLWENDFDPYHTAKVRFAYMDAVTIQVRIAFSEQIGDWCRAHKVEYIGHVVEDNNNHGRTGGSLGHYFRGLWGQDMAGIDDIGGQVMPQGEDGPHKFMHYIQRDGEFYHFILGRLGTSLAALDEKKKGRTMCEIFGNYGWQEGLRLERYLADHFMVNGVNRFVPHAFSAKDFPDPDCPPHFYANGHNPQYRHFKSLMKYMNRVCELIDGGKHIAPVALLYHAEAEWTGKAMLMQKPARVLTESQINFDIVPSEHVGEKPYQAIIIPYAQFISVQLADRLQALSREGSKIVFVDAMPEGFYDSDTIVEGKFGYSDVVQLDKLVPLLCSYQVNEIKLSVKNRYIRYLHYLKENDIYFFVNEGTDKYTGVVTLPNEGRLYRYDAWNNRLENIKYHTRKYHTEVEVEIEPMESLLLIFDEVDGDLLQMPLKEMEKEEYLVKQPVKWIRSIATSIEYPHFTQEEEVCIPDNLAKEQPHFSGWIKYETTIVLPRTKRGLLTISDAYEGVEVFINGISAGVQVVPVYRFDITDLLKEGKNLLTIEVSTTLERERAFSKNRSLQEKLNRNRKLSPIGITGEVKIYVDN